jgi:enoyl-CoA hydratase/carnithine racemase
MPPARLGVVYSHTGLRRFVDAIGAARTRELFLTARPITADTALAWGLVNEVVADAEQHGVALAAEIASLAPLSLRGTKRVLRALHTEPEPALLAELHALRDAAFRSEDFAEGVRAFTEKRQPRWRGS